MIIWASGTRQIINEMRAVIGREIELYFTVPGADCPACTLDPLTGTSSDPFCTTCSGAGYLTTVSAATLQAHINWANVDKPAHYPGGKIWEGDCKVTVEYTEENLQLVKTADYFVVDAVPMYLKNYDLKGVQDLNRIAVALLQDPRTKR